MANWWEEEDKYGYTYADKNRPGYMGQPIVEEEEDVEVTEDDKKFVKDVEEDNWESFQPEIRRAAELEERKEIGPDFTMVLPEEEFELTEEQKKLSKRLDDEKLPDIGLPRGGEPKILKEIDSVGEKKVKSLFKKAMSAKGKKRSDGYANVWKALQAYEGKDTPFLKGLKNRFSKKASATNNKQHLGDYKDYFDRGYSWQVSSPRRASVPTVNEYANTIEYDKDSILENADNFKDGVRIRGNRPKIMINDDVYSVTSNHMETGGHSMKDSSRSSQLLLKDGKVVRHPDGTFNYGLDLISNDKKIRNILGGKVVKIEEPNDDGKYPSGYGRRLIIKTNKMISVDGKDFPLFVHYAHATGDSFSDINVGDSLEPGQDIGTMGKTSTWGPSRTMGVHLDLNGYIIKDGKKVYVSPSEFVPLGPEEARRGKGFQEGGEVGYKDSWREEEETVEEIPEYLQRPEESFTPNVPEVPGFVPQQEPEDRGDVESSAAEEKVLEANLALENLKKKREEKEKLKQQSNLIEKARTEVEEFQRPDAEMIRKSHYEIQESLKDIDPKTGILSPEATQYLAQIPRQTLVNYRETYGSSGDRSKINDVIVQQESIVEEIDKADSLQLGKGEKKPIPPSRVSELDFLKIQRYKDERELRRAETESINQAMKQSAIDPERFYKNQSTFDKVVSLIGLAAGAYGAHKYGGPNVYIAELDKEVAKDIRAQKLDQDLEKRKFAAHNFKVATLAKRLARSAKNVTMQQNLIKIAQTAELKGMKIIKKQEVEKKKMLDIATLNKRGITDNELAYLMSKYPKLKIQESLITARDGKHYYIKGGRQAVKLMKTTLADTQDSIDGLRDLEGYVDKVKIWEQGWSPWAFFSTDRAEAGALRDRLVGKLRIEFFGPGVMTDNEREQAKKILGDPNAFWTTDAKEKAKIRTLIMKLNYGMRQKLRRDGLTMLPLSPNERRVEQLLKKNKLNDNPNNRVKIVNSLIEAEKEAVTQGQPAGKLWDMNEPLPI